MLCTYTSSYNDNYSLQRVRYTRSYFSHISYTWNTNREYVKIMCLNLWDIETRSKSNKIINRTWNNNISHWVIKTKLFLSTTQQGLKHRLIQVRYWDHKPPHIFIILITHVHSKMSFWNMMTNSFWILSWKMMLCVVLWP